MSKSLAPYEKQTSYDNADIKALRAKITDTTTFLTPTWRTHSLRR